MDYEVRQHAEAGCDVKIDQIESELSRLKTMQISDKKELRSAHAEISDLRSAVAEAEQALAALREELAKVKLLCNEEISNHSVSKDAIASLESEVADLKLALGRNGEQLEASREEVSSLENMLFEAKTANDDLKVQLRDTETRLIESEIVRTSYNKVLEDSNKVLEDSNKKLETDIIDLRNQISRNETDMLAVREEMSENSADILCLHATSSEVHRLQQEILVLKARSATSQKNHADDLKSLEVLQISLSLHREEIARLHDDLEQLMTERNQLNTEFTTLKAAQVIDKKELRSAHAEISDLRLALAEAEKPLAVLREELEKVERLCDNKVSNNSVPIVAIASQESEKANPKVDLCQSEEQLEASREEISSPQKNNKIIGTLLDEEHASQLRQFDNVTDNEIGYSGVHPAEEFGTFQWQSGNVYVGELKYGKKDGKGRFTWKSGAIYDGEWKDDLRNGFGTYTSSNSKDWIYEGFFMDDLYEGKGTYRWPDGRIYEGFWKKGKQEGHGIFFSADGAKIYDGLWASGKKATEEEPLVNYDVGMTIQTPYGAAIILEIRSDGVMSVEPTSWIDPKNKPGKFFISKKDLTQRNWTFDQVKVNQRDFAPPKDAPDGDCICF